MVAGQLYGSIQKRYRLTLVPVLLMYAAVGLIWIFNAFREKRFLRAAGGVGLILAVAVIQHAWIPLGTSDGYGPGAGYLPAARVYAVEGRFDRAVAEMVRLRQEAGQAPRSAGMVLDAFLLGRDYRPLWAKQLIEHGRRGEARQQVDQAAAYTRIAELSYPQYNLGLLYLKLDESEKAKEAFDRFLGLEPEGSRADDVRRIRARLSQPPERSMTH